MTGKTKRQFQQSEGIEMKPVYGFNFGKAVKKAETLINECVKEKEGMAFTKIYANINGQLFEINEPISLYTYQILHSDGTPFYEDKIH